MGRLALAFSLGAVLASAVLLWRARGSRNSSRTEQRDPDTEGERIGAREHDLADDLRGFLGDVAAQLGAEDAIFWMRATEHASFRPVAWNRTGAPPATPWGTERERALVAWAASEGTVTFDGAEEEPTLAAARVPLDGIVALGAAGEVSGALALHSESGLRASRGDLKLWLPRHGARLAQFVELQVTRNEVARQNRRMRALVRSAQEFQVTGYREGLERRVAACMVEACGADFAALVRWDHEARRGEVRHVTAEHPLPAPEHGNPVEAGSLVAAVCADGTPRLWQDARAVDARDFLYSRGTRVPRSGALALIPLRRGTASIGAFVVAAREAAAIRPADLRTAGLLAQLAAPALEAAWTIEEVALRAHTDQLTGLWNRRHFEAQLARVLNETDRFGGTCALVLADVDHFKEVNDTHGHETGDLVLRTLAEVMRAVVRTTDIAARIGGEEVCVILPQTALGGALELAERLRTALESTAVRGRSGDIRVTASLGVATYIAGAGSGDRRQLFDDADRAMYAAKSAGRNCVRTTGRSEE